MAPWDEEHHTTVTETWPSTGTIVYLSVTFTCLVLAFVIMCVKMGHLSKYLLTLIYKWLNRLWGFNPCYSILCIINNVCIIQSKSIYLLAWNNSAWPMKGYLIATGIKVSVGLRTPSPELASSSKLTKIFQMCFKMRTFSENTPNIFRNQVILSTYHR